MAFPHRSYFVYIGLLFAAVLLPGTLHAAAARRPARAAAARPDIILITVDTLRADHVGVYGSSPAATPAIDSLAAGGVVFDRAISQVPLTLASHVAILTGTYPFHNGVQDFTGQPLAPSFQTVAQAFQRNGYATAAVVSAFVLDRSWGLARGFDVYQDAFAPRSFVEKNMALVERPASQSVDLAIAWLKRRPGKPFFLWLHLYDPHSPYDPPEPFHSRYQHDLYSGEIAYADSQLGRLFQFLKASGIYDRAAIVLLSDHGESLGEHGEKEHGFFIYNSTVHVPLIVKPPAGKSAPPPPVATMHVTRPVEAAATAPTLLELAGIKDRIQLQFQTRSLVGLIHGINGKDEPAETTAYSETFYPLSSFGWSPLRGLQSERYHYIQAPSAELYNLPADSREQTNLLASQSAVASVFQDKLAQLVQRFPPPQQQPTTGVSPDTIAKLRALGYVAYKSPVPAEALAAGLPDPKSKVEEFNAILRAGDMLQLGDVAAGRKILEEARRTDPGMYIISFMLGEAALRQSEWEKASSEFEQCLKLNPSFDQAMTGLARALAQQGDLPGARQWLQKATAINPQNYRAWYALGFIESRNDPAAARVALQKVVEIQPGFAFAHRDLGWLEYRLKRYPDALVHFENAIRLGVKDKNTINAAGISASQTGKLAQAITYYKQAIAQDSNYADAHLNLALAYQRTNQVSASQAEYATACRLQPDFCRYAHR